jgi:orotidine-5'-phosphate decarboxylase
VSAGIVAPVTGRATMADPRVIVALDVASAADALALTSRLTPTACRLKVGKELFVAAGPALVEALVDRGFGVFLDLKFHDIPNTVAQACKAAARLGVWMVNVHASGGRAMLDAAREAIDAGTPSATVVSAAPSGAGTRPLLIAVTVLTSLSDAELPAIGWAPDAAARAVDLARLAHAAALDGVVCSARETPSMRHALGDDFLLVTPGIRPADAAADDQSRIATPAAAIAGGATYLVIGRPVTRAPDPLAALAAINAEIATQLETLS